MQVASPTTLEQHVRGSFRGRKITARRWQGGPSAELWPDLHVLHVEPTRGLAQHVFVSIGVSNIGQPYHREFVVLADDGGPHHVETLFMAAYYHHTELLDVGHTMPIGRPWRPGSRRDHFLVSLPYPIGPDFERLSHDGHDIRFLWLLPVYKAEVHYRHAHGLEALERRFEEAGFDVYGKSREAVV